MRYLCCGKLGREESVCGVCDGGGEGSGDCVKVLKLQDVGIALLKLVEDVWERKVEENLLNMSLCMVFSLVAQGLRRE